ncbi:hypothetical protein [Sphingobium sp. BS19]|uniref:hypothetical protein n=1 Tax=Sphingobium sp. BS19 TaxID=3018973 RepID=UPI0022EF088E|nr:hypothetical protein [Sphingobium sp. BS19]GLI97058.1 hypothetical protein Sbs19_08760 [Sphingobium sp. BS19]
MNSLKDTLHASPQNHMLGLRQEMGFPHTAPQQPAVGWTHGGPVNAQRVHDLAQLAGMTSCDLIYGAWDTDAQAAPDEYVLVLRKGSTVALIRHCAFYAADATAPVVIIAPSRNTHYALNGDLRLECRTGMPGADLAQGQSRALARINQEALARESGNVVGYSLLWCSGDTLSQADATDTAVRFD